MGGIGSGNSWLRLNTLDVVEDCKTLGIDDLIERHVAGDEVRTVEMGYQTRHGYINLAIDVVAETRRDGRRDWFIICPLIVNGCACKRRCRKLYRPRNARYFGCRECHRLSYRKRNEYRREQTALNFFGAELGISPKLVKLAFEQWAKPPKPTPPRKPYVVPTCGARTRAGKPCQRRPALGSRRCHLHGGKSTGPKSPEGVARSLAALKANRNRASEVSAIVHKARAHGRQLGREWRESHYFDADGAEMLWTDFADESAIPAAVCARARWHWYRELIAELKRNSEHGPNQESCRRASD